MWQRENILVLFFLTSIRHVTSPRLTTPPSWSLLWCYRLHSLALSQHPLDKNSYCYFLKVIFIFSWTPDSPIQLHSAKFLSEPAKIFQTQQFASILPSCLPTSSAIALDSLDYLFPPGLKLLFLHWFLLCDVSNHSPVRCLSVCLYFSFSLSLLIISSPWITSWIFSIAIHQNYNKYQTTVTSHNLFIYFTVSGLASLINTVFGRRKHFRNC